MFYNTSTYSTYTTLALQKCIRLNTKMYKEHLNEERQGTERILAKWNIIYIQYKTIISLLGTQLTKF